MALITNGQDIQNAIYGVLKKDGYFICTSRTHCVIHADVTRIVADFVTR